MYGKPARVPPFLQQEESISTVGYSPGEPCWSQSSVLVGCLGRQSTELWAHLP